MHVEFSQAALHDIEQIAETSLELFGKAHRDAYMNRLRSELESLPHYLSISRPVEKRPTLRCWYFSSHAIYFRQVDDDLEVVRVLHKAQVPADHLFARVVDNENE